MSISGLVLTLSGSDTKSRRAIANLHADLRLTLGERAGRRLPAVAATTSVEEDERLVTDLRAIEGIEGVEIVFVGLDEQANTQVSPQAKRDTGGVG